MRNSNIKQIVKKIIYSFITYSFVLYLLLKQNREKTCGALAQHSPYVHPPLGTIFVAKIKLEVSTQISHFNIVQVSEKEKDMLNPVELCPSD